jgi:hypothetical protein
MIEGLVWCEYKRKPKNSVCNHSLIVLRSGSNCTAYVLGYYGTR